MPRHYDDDDDRMDDLDVRKPNREGEVPNYLVQSILITFCCCLPFGIAAIVSASKVNPALARGDYDEAVRASEAAKKWCWIGAILGLIFNVIYVAFQAFEGQRGGGFR